MTLPDPKTLSAAQRRGLGLVGRVRPVRAKGGWGYAPEKLSLDVASSMQALGLVRVDRNGPNPRLVLTGAGQSVLGVIQQRRARA